MHWMFSRQFRGLLCCMLTAPACLLGQGPTTGSIEGTVVSTVEPKPQDAVAWTDAEGRFSFHFLPAGRYQVQASKDGFQPAAFGAESRGRPPAIVTLGPGENRTDINFRLAFFGIISGVILDEAGDPLPNASMQALRMTLQRQKRTLVPAGGTSTDGEGRYRMPNIMPGKYVVLAQKQDLTFKRRTASGSAYVRAAVLPWNA
jgi:hypothetical protein